MFNSTCSLISSSKLSSIKLFSINEFSAILVGLLPIAINYFEEKKKNILLITVILLTLLCSLLIGTKILLGGVVFCIIYLIWKNRNIVYFNRTKKH